MFLKSLRCKNIYNFVSKKHELWRLVFFIVTNVVLYTTISWDYINYGPEILPVYFSYITYISLISFTIYFNLWFISKYLKLKWTKKIFDYPYFRIWLAFISFIVFWGYFILGFPFSVATRSGWLNGGIQSPFDSYGVSNFTFWMIMTIFTHGIITSFYWIDYRIVKTKINIKQNICYSLFFLLVIYAVFYMLGFNFQWWGEFTFTKLTYSFLNYIQYQNLVIIVWTLSPFAFYLIMKYIIITSYKKGIIK